MKLNFKTYTAKSFLTEGTSDYGIPHIEDLDIEAFLRVLEKLHEFSAVQKLDGANLRVGLDDDGELFTSREQKGGLRFYKESDYPKNSAYDGFRAAHAVLEKAEGYFMQVLVPGESINLEILYGPQPNTVFYGKDNLNYIALLEMLPGDDPSTEPDQNKIKQLMKLLQGKIFVVKTVFSDTTDGVTIVRTPNVSDWKFTISDVVPEHEIKKVNFVKELGTLKAYLSKENEVAREAGRDLTNFEIMKDRSRDLSDERKSVEDKVLNDFKLPIKAKLLELIYKQKPSLRGVTSGTDDGVYKGIEGIIFTNPKNGERFKIVDKDVFLEINKFNYQSRKAIAGRITTSDPNMPIEARGGIVGEARLRSVHLFGLENAEMPSQTKKVLEKFKGDNREETITAIEKSLNQLDFQSVKRKIQAIYISALDDIEDALDAFKKGADDYHLQLKNGQIIKYTKEIKRRTLMVFAEARRSLIETLNSVRRCADMYDLIEIFFKRQLDQLFGEGK
jgi:hypothetical protein